MKSFRSSLQFHPLWVTLYVKLVCQLVYAIRISSYLICAFSMCVLNWHSQIVSSMCVLNWHAFSMCLLNVHPQFTTLMCILYLRRHCASSMCILNVRPQCAFFMYDVIVRPQCASSMYVLNVHSLCVSSLCVLDVRPNYLCTHPYYSGGHCMQILLLQVLVGGGECLCG